MPANDLSDPSRWAEEDRKREEYILFQLGNDIPARLFWKWLGEEAEKRADTTRK